MNGPLTISTTPPSSITMDYAKLRAAGLKYIEQMGSALWTDYNAHDPGITILETLCYAITDLGYRTSMPIENLLCTPIANAANFRQQFYSAKEILTSCPVTEVDYRKLFIDIDGVKNAWLFRHKESLFVDCKEKVLVPVQPEHPAFRSFDLNGLYDVRIELDELPEDDCKKTEQTPEEKASLEQKQKVVLDNVREVFHHHRNLCEDLASLSIVEEHKVCVCMDVELKPDAVAIDVYTEMLYQITNYFSPPVQQYSLSQMLALKKEDGSAYTMDEIFNGPVLTHGFILDEEVLQSGLRSMLYTSDIISLLLDIPGVLAVKNFVMSHCDAEQKERHEWCLPVPDGKKPVLCACDSAIHFFRDVIPVKVSREAAVQKLRDRLQKEKEAALAIRYEDYVYPVGAYPDTEDYTSVAHHLPQNYGVGNDGLPLTATDERRILVKQLKGYLLFFDQVLANYLSQLNGAKELFRVRGQSQFPATPQTYFFQKVTGLRDVTEFYDDYDNLNKPSNLLDNLSRKFDNAVDRKNRFLDHLLSRFAETFNDYVLQLYTLTGQKAAEEIISNKTVFLEEYPQISACRASAFDYFNPISETGDPVPVWDTANVTGMEHRLSRLLGISNYNRRTLSSIKTDVAEETDSSNNPVFSFRIIDPKDSKILITSNVKFPTREAADVSFRQMIERGSDRNNYDLKQSADGKFFFTINDPAGAILARRFQSFKNRSEAQQAINYLQTFILQNYLDEGLFVVEHILLRQDLLFLAQNPTAANKQNFIPVCLDGDCGDGCEDDPYSFRITVVLPAESVRFRDFDFRTYIEKTIRLETPAHIYPRVCWWSRQDLKAFEDLYQQWLQNKQAGQVNTEAGLQNLRDLIRILFERKSIYPTGRLDDCDKPVDNPVIVNRTALGNLKTG